jgi:putative ABC transport system substrate-binding protein
VTGIIVADAVENFINRFHIVQLLAHHRMPAIFPFREYVDAGGLISYGIDLPEVYRDAVRQIHRVLKGARPAEVPFLRPTKFELIMNVKVAKEIGITLPPLLLARADEVIE